MDSSHKLFTFILFVTESLVGMMGNGFIAIINFIHWKRRQKLSPADLILSCLSLFRFALHAAVIQFSGLNLFYTGPARSTHVKIANYTTWTFITTNDLWFAAWLSVFYCIKIANFTHPLFLKMKRKFSGLVPWLLLGTVAFSAVTTIVAITSTSAVSKCNIFKSSLSNSSDTEMEMPEYCWPVFFLYAVPNFLSFLIFLSSSILLLTSLWRHKNQLRNSAKDVSTEAHLNAIKALASFFFLYVSSFSMELLSVSFHWIGITPHVVTVIIVSVISIYSFGHAVILIFMNPRLKQESKRILHQLNC